MPRFIKRFSELSGTMNISRIIIPIITFLYVLETHAQDMPIGQWQSHLPYNTAVSIATDDVRIYVASRYGFYVRSIATEETTPYSKVNGMSDLGMSKIAYDDFTDAVILAYENSNIDLFKDGLFYNIPDLKLKSVAGTKRINNILTENGLAYLSTDIGVVVLNLSRNEVKETYTFTQNSQNIPILDFDAYGDYFYAATSAGLYRARKNSANLQAFQAWTLMDSTRNFTTIVASNNNLFLAMPDSMFVLSADTFRHIYTSDSSIINLVTGVGSVWVMEFSNSTFRGKALRMNMDYIFTDTLNTGLTYELLDMANPDSTKWISNSLGVMQIRKGEGEPYNTLPPAGPGDVTNYDIYVRNKEILVAHGGYDDKYIPLNNGSGFSVYKEGEWKNYRRFVYPPFGDSIVDFVNIIKGPDDNIYAGSTQSGLFILKPDGSNEYYKQNSFIDPSSTGSTLYRISGLAFDNDDVLWATVLGGSPNELVARTTDGQWYKFSIPYSRNIPHSAAHLAVDNNNQKWFAAPGGGGVIVYDDNHTPENPVDDSYIQLVAGEGSGGLPDNEVLCLANDKSGSMWIGTANGIGIVNCPSQVIQRQCEAEKRVVQFDQFAGYLFQNEQVRTIAVDGANRKWIGTNNGIWLISPNGDEILERYTKDNSPLPTDIIQKISIDPTTGDVYIGTELGLVSYRGTAIDGGKENSDLITYPNPVPSGYSGTIAIKGFVENADVRITDISGQLIYRTTALGGQAVWNGKDYTGRRPQSGVYLIFGTNRDGTQTVKGKMVFME